MNPDNNKVTIKNEGSPQIFKNPILERLTHTHISIPLTIFYGCSIGLIVYSMINTHVSGLTVAGMFWGGFLFFTLIEYLMHRYVFHIAENTRFKKRFQYVVHGVHHEYPKDKGRLVMPPLVSLTLAVMFVVLFKATMGQLGFGFAAGFLSGYATYLSIHYATHIFKPPKGFFKKWWVNHAIHHYKDQTVAFGVSSPLWDFVFNTYPKRNKKKTDAKQKVQTA